MKNLEAIVEDDEANFDSNEVDISQISAICLSKFSQILQNALLIPISAYAF